jgi:succinate dehydrogenase / fumarate reductase cytochrome b subunit
MIMLAAYMDMPYLLFIEIGGIFVPLLFHSIYGIMISAEAKPNPFNYGIRS